MKLYKLFFIAAIALGFMACNADDQPEVPQLEQETDTYASITVKFPGTVGTRAELPGDYNAGAEWTGRDELSSVTVFLVNMDRAEVIHDQFTAEHFIGIEDGNLKPSLAIKATAGDMIRAYVVINGEESILTKLKATTAANFAGVFAAEYAKKASEVAKYNKPEDPATTGTETIMMTNDVDGYSTRLLPGISDVDAINGRANHIKIQVERVVSRAFMTVVERPDTGWPVYAVIGGDPATEIARVTDVTYAVGQSNKNFYLMKQSSYAVPAPVYGFMPTTFDDWKAPTNTKYFDYEGLANFTSITQWIGGTKTVIDYLGEEGTSKFVLPVNHEVELEADEEGARDAYRKGNTTFFEIRATFIPNELIGGTVTVDTETKTATIGATTTSKPTAAKTVYWGENDKKFYTNRALAEAYGQKATEFTNGVMKYVLWLNPNSLVSTPTDPNPKVSPTVRNQIYHAHIDAFLRMGLPNNPLNPDDPDNPLDPDVEGNPDNPINPEDLLKTDYTYLSVSVQVLDWTINSYIYDLKDPGTMY